MLNILRGLATFTSVFLCSISAWSHDHLENEFYIGIKAGALFADEPKADSINPIGVQFEYHFNPNIAVEIDYIKGSSDKDDLPNKANMESLGVYAVLRSKNSTYALVKVGLEDDLGTSKVLNQNGISLSAGIGAGVILNRHFSIESEYTWINENQKFLGITFRYGFFD